MPKSLADFYQKITEAVAGLDREDWREVVNQVSEECEYDPQCVQSWLEGTDAPSDFLFGAAIEAVEAVAGRILRAKRALT